MATSPIFPGTVQAYQQSIANADASNLKTLATGATAGTKVKAIIATTDETVARDVQIGRTVSSVFYPLGTIQVPIGAGNSSSVPSVNMLNLTKIPGLPVDSDGNPFLFLKSGETLQAKAMATVTSGKTIWLNGAGSDF